MKNIPKIFFAITILIAILVSSESTFAGVSIDWIRTIFNPHLEHGAAIARDASDNTYAAGHGNGIIYLTKRDHFGNFQWDVSSTSNQGEIAVKALVDPQGNPVVLGFRYSSLEEGAFAVSLILLKYDANGNLLYKKSIDGTYSYPDVSGNFVTKVTAQMDGAGNVYIATGGLVNGQPDDGFNVIKVSSAGTILWIRTETFGGTPFYLVENIRLKGNKLGLVGPTSHSNGNPGIWILDTTGTTSWSTVKTGVGANDIAMDLNGNFYVLTLLSNKAGANTGLDLCLYKFNQTGTQLWLKGYDFGSNEIGLRIELGPDNKLVIMAQGSQINGGMPYQDWLILKVKLSGVLLWSSRYDHTTGNDEIPRMMIVDTKNNIYVTGDGGPFPGGNNLGALQGVTLKYSKSGTVLWTALLDTLVFNGVDIAMASDKSLFVISGSLTSPVVHYLQSTGTNPCSVPVNLSATGITNSTATVHWDAVANAFLYHVEYKTSSSSIWIGFTTDATLYVLTGLSLGTIYDYRIEAVCNGGPTGFSPVSQFTTTGSGYCISKGLNASNEWIDYVGLNAISNLSASNNGYADFTSMSASLMQGSTSTIMLRLGMPGAIYTGTWRVWIDYNHDGDFTDATEQIAGYQSNTAGLVFTDFIVPATATTGNTRMRISMKKGNPAQTSCETFSLGEVEDYTVNITPQKMGSTSETVSETVPEVSVFPNPATNDLTAKFSGYEGSVSVQIFDLFGKVIFMTTTNSGDQFQMDVHELASGVYILRATDEQGHTASLKWIKE